MGGNIERNSATRGDGQRERQRGGYREKFSNKGERARERERERRERERERSVVRNQRMG